MTKIKTKRVPANRKWTKKQLKDARWALDFLAAQHYSTLGSLSDQVGQGIPVLEKMYRRAEREYFKKVTVHLKTAAVKPRITAEDKRVVLLRAGWERKVPTKGVNKGRELWSAPRSLECKHARYMTLAAAFRTHLNDWDKSRPAASKSKKKPNSKKKKIVHVCESCGTKKNVEFAPCPYVSDLDGDYTPVHLCVDCRNERVRGL